MKAQIHFIIIGLVFAILILFAIFSALAYKDDLENGHLHNLSNITNLEDLGVTHQHSFDNITAGTGSSSGGTYKIPDTGRLVVNLINNGSDGTVNINNILIDNVGNLDTLSSVLVGTLNVSANGPPGLPIEIGDDFDWNDNGARYQSDVDINMSSNATCIIFRGKSGSAFEVC